jgi:hypothetical protein
VQNRCKGTHKIAFNQIFLPLPQTFRFRTYMRTFFILLATLTGMAATAQTLDTIAIPFFDDFAGSKDGNANPRLWQQSSIYVNSTYTYTQQTTQIATFDIVDVSGRVYPSAGVGNFAADTLASQALNIRNTDANVYLSFSFLPGGLGDMPEQEDSLLLYFFNPAENTWSLQWSAYTNASMKRRADTITQHYPFFENPNLCPTCSLYVDTLLIDTLTNKFITTMVKLPSEFCMPGFRFMFVNWASRGHSEVSGMMSNCDLWHMDYVYLAANRNPNRIGIQDMAIQRPPTSLLKEYTAMPLRHIANNSIAQREQMLAAGGLLHIPFYVRNLSATSNPVNIDLSLQMQSGGNILERYPYDDVVGQNIYADTTQQFTPFLPNTPYILDALNSAVSVVDSVSVEVKVVLRRYSAEPTITNLLLNNDTGIFVQKFYDYYAYDDGTAENGYGVFGENAEYAEIAVKFHTYRTDTLSGVYIYFNHSADEGNMALFTLILRRTAANGSPGDLLYSQRVEAKFNGLNQYVWYPFEHKTLVREGDFFVCIKQSNEAMLNIGLDANINGRPLLVNKTWLRTDAVWKRSGVDSLGSLMIRPSFRHTVAPLETYAPPLPQKTIAMSIYPNPAQSVVNFLLPVDGNADADVDYGDLTITIVDVTGRSIMRQPFAESMYVGGMEDGIYFVRVSAADGTTIAVQKLIVRATQ